MKRNKFSPIKSKINSIKKTKVQFSTRLSSCLGEHQSQEFFERLNITRQSGICSKNKNNSFGENKSHSFRQTLQLNIPFVADLSDFKELCICYPVHFFRRKLHSYDSEDSRLASVRVYYPASRMKYGNEFKVSMDLKKRYHLQPHQYEFVAYSNLLTLSLEDLALAVFRAKSLSEKFKIVHSLPIPKILLSTNNFTSQIGSPIFIGTERIYSRLSKLLCYSQSNNFQKNSFFTTNSDSDLYIKKCILKWVGLGDFLPLSSRLVFIRRVSEDTGDTLGCSILNSPGPKIRRSRLKEGDRLSIRLKQAKLELAESNDNKTKLLIEPVAHRTKNINFRFQNNKRPRGRPKKSLDNEDKTPSELHGDINNISDAVISTNIIEEKLKGDSLHLKTESISNSLIDSTSEEKYSIHLSACSTPDTIKSRSPIALNGSVTTTINSTASISQIISSTNDTYIVIKNKRGRPRKYPTNIQEDSNIKLTLSKNKSGNFEVLSKSQDYIDNDDNIICRKRSSNNSCSSEPSGKICKVSHYCVSVSNSENSKIRNLESSNQLIISGKMYCNIQCSNLSVHSMWKPLKYKLLPPDPIVPFIKQISSTGFERNPQINGKINGLNQHKSMFNDIDLSLNSYCHNSSCKTDTQNQSKGFSLQSNLNGESDFVQNYQNSLFSNKGKNDFKESNFNSEIDMLGANPYRPQNNIFSQLMLPSNSSSVTNNYLGILSPYFNNINSHNGPINNIPSPITLNLSSMFPSSNSSQLPSLPIPSQYFVDNSGHLLFSSNNTSMSYTQNPVLSSNAPLNHPTSTQHQSYNQILLASRYELNNTPLSWSNSFQWKY